MKEHKEEETRQLSKSRKRKIRQRKRNHKLRIQMQKKTFKKRSSFLNFEDIDFINMQLKRRKAE